MDGDALMIPTEKLEKFVRLINNGINTTPKLISKGFTEGEINHLTSPAHVDSVADRNKGNYTLNQRGANMLYELQKQDKANTQALINLIAAVIAAITGIISILLQVFQQ